MNIEILIKPTIAILFMRLHHWLRQAKEIVESKTQNFSKESSFFILHISFNSPQHFFSLNKIILFSTLDWLLVWGCSMDPITCRNSISNKIYRDKQNLRFPLPKWKQTDYVNVSTLQMVMENNVMKLLQF